MSKRDAWNRCEECGRFVSYQDILDGKATHVLVTPESLITHERFETLCSEHANPSTRPGFGMQVWTFWPCLGMALVGGPLVSFVLYQLMGA